jgi:transposase
MGWSKIKIASSSSVGEKPRMKEIAARDLQGLMEELAKAKKRFGLPASAPVQCCYEAGRDGFWLHRWLTTQGIANVVVDPGSLRVERRRKRAKTDRIDAAMLLSNLYDHVAGKKGVWSVVHVPTLVQEEQRQLHREFDTLKGERTEHVNRIKGILASLGLKLDKVDGKFASWLDKQKLLETGEGVPTEYRDRLLREHRRWELANEQMEALETEQKRRVAARDEDAAKAKGDKSLAKVRKLMRLKGIGIKSAWLLVYEFFGWRDFKNRRQVGSLAGLTPTPYQSGDTSKELGLNKAGNRWVRSLIVEVAWGWLQWQPNSALTKWFRKRFGSSGSRSRKKGIVALARKLLIALWRWLEFDEKPKGAVEVDWQSKVKLPRKLQPQAA